MTSQKEKQTQVIIKLKSASWLLIRAIMDRQSGDISFLRSLWEIQEAIDLTDEEKERVGWKTQTVLVKNSQGGTQYLLRDTDTEIEKSLSNDLYEIFVSLLAGYPEWPNSQYAREVIGTLCLEP